MSVEVSYASNITVAETLETNPHSANAASRVVTHSLFNTALALDAASSPAVAKVAAFKKALAAGSGTIDLTALTGTNGATVDGTNLKVQIVKIKNIGDNPLVIIPAVSNGYELLGSDFKITLEAGDEVTFQVDDTTPAIGSGAKDLTLTGTLIEESEWMIVMG